MNASVVVSMKGKKWSLEKRWRRRGRNGRCSPIIITQEKQKKK
jgi:hypothetical protein